MSSESPITAEMLEIILNVTRITAEPMRSALHDHFVLGHTQVDAAERYGIKKQQLGPHVRRIRTELLPAFDAYAECAMRSAGMKLSKMR